MDNDYLSFNLKSKDIENSISTHVYGKFLLIIRNVNDYSYFYTDGGKCLKIFNILNINKKSTVIYLSFNNFNKYYRIQYRLL